MMKHKLFLFLLLTCFIGCKIQKDYNYLNFYKFINDAELAVTEENYKEAHDIYSKAFKIWEKPPTIDYYNALLCAVKLKKNKTAFKYLELLALRGWEMDFFSKNPHLSKLRNEKEWQYFVNKYSQLHQTYLESLDTVLMNELDSMLQRDQSLVNSNQYSEYLKTVISNANRINELIHNNQTDNIHFGSSVYSVGYSPFHSVLLRHYGGIYNEVQKNYIDVSNIVNDTLKLVNLEESMLKEIKKGHLSPLVYDFVTTYSGDLNKYGNGIFFKVGEVVLKKNFSEKEIKNINTNRESIGQENIEDYTKKMAFINQVKDSTLKRYYFKFRVTGIMYQMKGDEDKLQKFIENRLDDGWQIISH